MEPVRAVLWSSSCLCLSLTTLLIFCGCRLVQRHTALFTYYTNVLIANVTQICAVITILLKPDDRRTSSISSLVFYLAVMASLYFKMCIALERYFFITCPLVVCLRQAKGSVLVCVLLWALFIICLPFAIVLQQYLRLIFLTLLPGLVFNYCLFDILQALPGAASVPPEEKRRTAGMLVSLILNYLLMMLPSTIFYIVMVSLHYHFDIDIPDIILTLSLLSPFVDLMLFLFMWEGPTDQLLACLCRVDKPAADEAADQQSE